MEGRSVPSYTGHRIHFSGCIGLSASGLVLVSHLGKRRYGQTQKMLLKYLTRILVVQQSQRRRNCYETVALFVFDWIAYSVNRPVISTVRDCSLRQSDGSSILLVIF